MLQKLTQAIGLGKRGAAILLSVGAAWFLVVVCSGAGWNPFNVQWDFSTPGAFGDSFGPLSTFMAALAALGAIAAYRSQAQELSASKARQEEQDLISMSDRERVIRREIEADRKAEKASFETTFFNMLTSFRSLVSSIDLRSGERIVSAHDAFASIVKSMQSTTSYYDNNVPRAWGDIAESYKTDLNHYFRFLYHTVLFVHDSPVTDKYFYVRLIRATLSEPELSLLALNCGYGEGREKFKKLVEEYSLLHNLSDAAVYQWNLRDLFDPRAFHREASPGE